MTATSSPRNDVHPTTAAPRMAWIGASDAAEFAELRSPCAQLAENGRPTEWATIPAFLAAGAADCWDVIVFWQQWPEEFPGDQILALLTAAPLSRLVCVYGAWCESDGRTRAHWPPSVRVPVWKGLSRIEAEIAVWAGHSQPLPLTAGRDEVWLFEAHHTTSPQLAGLRVSLDLCDSTFHQMVKESLTAAGANIVIERTQADVILFDCEPWTPEREALLRESVADAPTGGVLGIAGWITPQWRAELAEIGVRRLVHKLDPAGLLKALVEREQEIKTAAVVTSPDS